MAAIQKVVLLKLGNAYKARPAYIVAEPSDKIRFLNFTDASIVLSFPNGPFTSGSTLVAGGGWDATVPSTAAAGRYVYEGSVSGGANNPLEGESSPEIIIDRFGLTGA
jgi:hypothetical protein